MDQDNTKTVFVGLSGGVDSSVSAALCQEAGLRVVGVFIRVWQPDFLDCSFEDDRRDAIRVCAHLGIPFKEVDLETEYKQEVVDQMITEYKVGRTPNPDIICNRSIKFGGFFDWAMEQGADLVATGHYARIKETDQGFLLQTGLDKNKDQSYFLWTLGQKQLAKTLFPVGEMQKSKVRQLAEKFGLPTALKKDSQGVCFLGKIDMKEFLKHYIKEQPGQVLDQDGQVIGRHQGAYFFTLGERHGLQIDDKHAGHGPFYVIEKDIKANTLTVAKDLDSLESKSDRIKIADINWLCQEPKVGQELLARTRYRQSLEKIKILSLAENSAEVKFQLPQITATAGQSLVIYDGDVCLGGGVIV